MRYVDNAVVLVKDVANYDILAGKRGLFVVNTVSERLVETVVLYREVIVGLQRSESIVEYSDLSFCNGKVVARLIERIVRIGERLYYYVIVSRVDCGIVVGQRAVGIEVFERYVNAVARYETGCD